MGTNEKKGLISKEIGVKSSSALFYRRTLTFPYEGWCKLSQSPIKEVKGCREEGRGLLGLFLKKVDKCFGQRHRDLYTFLVKAQVLWWWQEILNYLASQPKNPSFL